MNAYQVVYYLVRIGMVAQTASASSYSLAKMNAKELWRISKVRTLVTDILSCTWFHLVIILSFRGVRARRLVTPSGSLNMWRLITWRGLFWCVAYHSEYNMSKLSTSFWILISVVTCTKVTLLLKNSTGNVLEQHLYFLRLSKWRRIQRISLITRIWANVTLNSMITKINWCNQFAICQLLCPLYIPVDLIVPNRESRVYQDRNY